MSTDLRTLQNEAWQIAEDHGFHERPTTPLERLALICSEVGEAVEEVRDGVPLHQTTYGPGGKPLGFASEIADVVIRCLDLAAVSGFDLQLAVLTKMAYNRTRPRLHGRTV